jgi:hypothetical protein
VVYGIVDGSSPSAEPWYPSLKGPFGIPHDSILSPRKGNKLFEHYVVQKQPRIQREYENFFFSHGMDFNGLEMRNIARLFEDIKHL